MRALSPLFIGLLALLLLMKLCLFTVYETQRALVERLGKIEMDSKTRQYKVLQPGLHMKLPFIDTIRFFDTQVQLLDIPSSRIVTNEKKDVIVDLFVQWRVNNFPLFYTRTDGVKKKAEILLRQKVIDGLRAAFGRRTIKDVVSGERDQLMMQLKQEADRTAKELGIEVVDVRIKQINLPSEVSVSVYERMRTERERVAKELRGTGEARAEAIRAASERKVRTIVAEARKKAQTLYGEGEATAAKVYASAYGQAPNFSEFYQSIQAYLHAFDNKQNIMVLKPDSQFFKYFRGVSVAKEE